MRSPCYQCVCVSPPTLKAGIVEPEETALAIPYKYISDMTSKSRNCAVREASWRGPLLGNGSVIRSFNSWVSACCDLLLTAVLRREVSCSY
jgi:hypothetical protein